MYELEMLLDMRNEVIFPQRSAALNVSRSPGGVCPPTQASCAATDTRGTDAVLLSAIYSVWLLWAGKHLQV